MTVQIELPRGRVALIDDEDETLIAGYGWWVAVSRGVHRPTEYARGYTRGVRYQPLMHKLLTGWTLVDHINGNGLDNRRENLRPATRSQNMGNRRKIGRLATSQYKGVSLHTQERRWVVYIGFELGKHFVGLFDDEVAAAMAYDEAARRQWGEYAALNFPGPGERSALTGAVRS